jgi:DNA-binding protein HU-beta
MIPRGESFVVDRALLAREISVHTPGLSEAGALQIVDIVVGEIAAALRRSGDVIVPSLGRFRVKRRAARRGRNPATGAAIDIAAKDVITFRPNERFNSRVFDGG